MRELLLCSPDYYGIEYEINPWMSRARGAEASRAQEQWRGLHATLSNLECKIDLVPPQPGLPDMVFAANAGLVIGKRFIPSNFRHTERAGEGPHFASWMEKRGYQIAWLPKNYYFEGEGDALFGGDALFPAAFDEYGQHAIREHVSDLIAVAPEEAMHFCCNAVPLERDIVLPEGAPKLVAVLSDRGYNCHQLPMTEFLKAGGACKCLTLFLPQREKT